MAWRLHGKMNMKRPCCTTGSLIYNAERETDNGSQPPREKLYHFNGRRGKDEAGWKVLEWPQAPGPPRRCFWDKWVRLSNLPQPTHPQNTFYCREIFSYLRQDYLIWAACQRHFLITDMQNRAKNMRIVNWGQCHLCPIVKSHWKWPLKVTTGTRISPKLSAKGL